MVIGFQEQFDFKEALGYKKMDTLGLLGQRVPTGLWVGFLTSLTLTAFAANSLLCRIALGGDLIDPMLFTWIRLSSGALALWVIVLLRNQARSGRRTRPDPKRWRRHWVSGLGLFAYASAFSLAYVSLETGTGALVLFGAVQITMIAFALGSGDPLGMRQGTGVLIALGGLVYLVFPGLAAPDPRGASLMGIAGISWGIYSVLGKETRDPILETHSNFLCSLPFTGLLGLLIVRTIEFQLLGLLLALSSGIITSGLGYVLWFKCLPLLTTVQASALQLLVPVLAAFGGFLFLQEELTLRLFLASILILGGVGLVITARKATPYERA